MSSQTVVIQTSDGKILDIFGNVDTTVVILDDFLEERRNASIIELDNGLTRLFQCAVKRRGFSVGEIPTRQLTLQPVATGAVVEATKRSKPSV